VPARQGKRRKPKRVIGDPHEPDGFGEWVPKYLEWLRIRNYSPRTVTNAESSLALFVGWCEDRGLGKPREVTRAILERYQRHLYYARKPDGKPLSFRSQRVRLVPVRGLYKWLVRQHVLPSNPASELDLPRLPQRLPQAVLSEPEVEVVLGQADLRSAIGVRDRAMLEVFYSTGVRRRELSRLRVVDLDTERGTLMVRQGKGRKDRMIPIGERAIWWVERYLEQVRPELVMPPDEGWLFLTTLGEPLTPDWLTQRVRGYVQGAELGKKGSCHLFRHTMATLMLENGADIRHIQEMLGHAHLESTQVYTRVAIQKLQAIHAATHPGARLRKTQGAAADLSDTDDTDLADEA
jgi:integrase/recombinase XerD